MCLSYRSEENSMGTIRLYGDIVEIPASNIVYAQKRKMLLHRGNWCCTSYICRGRKTSSLPPQNDPLLYLYARSFLGDALSTHLIEYNSNIMNAEIKQFDIENTISKLKFLKN